MKDFQAISNEIITKMGNLSIGTNLTSTGISPVGSSTTAATGFSVGHGSTGFGTSAGQTNSSMFGTNTGATSSLFGQTSATGAFGGASASIATVGTTVPFNPPNGQDTMMKSGVTTNINTKHQCITAMKEYENKTLEELRVEDYSVNRTSKQAGSTSTVGLFGQTLSSQANTGFGGGLGSGLQTSTTGFGTSPGFGGSSVFGVQPPLAGGRLFGGGASGTTGSTGDLCGSSGGTGFGQIHKPGGLSFGANATSNTGGLFGGTSQATKGTSSLFSTPAAGTGFGAIPGGFTGFGTSASQKNSSLFGTNTGATSSLFAQTSATGAFGGASASIATVGTTVLFNPPNGQDTMMKSGVTTNINTKHQCITAMKEYENKSLEELRMEDYSVIRISKQARSASTVGLFGETPSTQANTGFVFGGGLGSGRQTSTTGFGSFGTSAGQTGSSLFGTNTGATSSLFAQTSATGAFGGASASIATVGTTVPFNPPNGQDTMMKSGVTTNINTKHQCITAMTEYENKSLEDVAVNPKHTHVKVNPVNKRPQNSRVSA